MPSAAAARITSTGKCRWLIPRHGMRRHLLSGEAARHVADRNMVLGQREGVHAGRSSGAGVEGAAATRAAAGRFSASSG